jgi:hypothetical protein
MHMGTVTNSLAYCHMESITTVKSFIKFTTRAVFSAPFSSYVSMSLII